MDIIAAWAHESRERRDIMAMDEDRVEVLLTFAKHVTTPPMSKDESDAWRQRHHWPQNADWWMSHVWEVEEVYLESDRNPGAMRNKAQQIVCRSIRRSLTSYNKPVETTTAAAMIVASTIGGDVDTNQLNMAGDQRGYQHNSHPPPAAPALKNSAYRTDHYVSSDGLNLDDDADDDNMEEDDSRYIDAAAGPGIGAPPSTLSQYTETCTTNSSSPPGSIASVGGKLPTLAATISTTPGRHPKTNTVSTGYTAMGPFLTIDMWGLNNRRTVLPISYGTTLAGALVQATPAILMSTGINVSFEGVGADWAGKWDDWRWDMVMKAAESELIRVELRLVVVMDE